MSDDLEQRLRESLRAYADVVDAPDDDASPPRPAGARPFVRRWRSAVVVAAAVAVVATGSVRVVSGQREGADSASTPAVARVDEPERTPEGAEAPAGTAADSVEGSAAALAGEPVPYVLHTHCGIYGTDIGGAWFAADPPLVGEGGRPPSGWGDPEQPGALQLLTADEALFTDDRGHSVRLTRNEAARPPLCQ